MQGNENLVGFLINPVAGMGGRVGLKGTDGKVRQARELGAEPVASDRASRGIEAVNPKTSFLTCRPPMGEKVLENADLDYETIYEPNRPTSAEDTVAACTEFLKRGVKLVVFCGGDGTARDVYNAVDGEIPVLGVPAGVKMQSGVFAKSPEKAWKALENFLKEPSTREAEIVDVDEEAYREGRLETKIQGVSLTPDSTTLQGSKTVNYGGEREAKKGIGKFVSELMRSGRYVLGPGSTTRAVAEQLGQDSTLLGADFYENGKLVRQDMSEKGLLEEVRPGDIIVVSPIGSQGFVFGRGNQQISAAVIERAGAGNVLVVGTPHKMRNTKRLLVDTGSKETDAKLSGKTRVICGYRLALRTEIRPA